MHKVFGHLKASTTNFEQYSFKVGLPFSLSNPLGVLHDLTGSLGLGAHLEMLRILEHGHRHLLGWHFVAAALNDFSCSLVLPKTELNPSSDKPDLPFDIVWAVLNRVTEEADSLLTFIHAVISLGSFDVDLPVQFFRHVLEHLIENRLKRVKLFLTTLFVHLFV